MKYEMCINIDKSTVVYNISKYLALAILAIAFSFTSCKTTKVVASQKAENLIFSNMKSLPEARSAITSASNSESIFVVGGFGPNTQFSNEIYQYDVDQNSWSILTNGAIAKRFASTAIVDGYLYVFNGLMETNQLNEKVEKVNLKDGSIQYMSDNPQPARVAGVTVWDNKIYSFGGTIGPDVYSNKLFVFDPGEDTWTELSDIPYKGETKGEIVDGKLYIIGGYNGTPYDKVDVYDISTDTWEPSIVLPSVISGHSTAVLDSKIFIIGDYLELNTVAYFETSDNSFHHVISNMKERRHCTAEVIGSDLFAIGGNITSNISSSISSVQKANLLSITQR